MRERELALMLLAPNRADAPDYMAQNFGYASEFGCRNTAQVRTKNQVTSAPISAPNEYRANLAIALPARPANLMGVPYVACESVHETCHTHRTISINTDYVCPLRL